MREASDISTAMRCSKIESAVSFTRPCTKPARHISYMKHFSSIRPFLGNAVRSTSSLLSARSSFASGSVVTRSPLSRCLHLAAGLFAQKKHLPAVDSSLGRRSPEHNNALFSRCISESQSLQKVSFYRHYSKFSSSPTVPFVPIVA